jgi:hypothetical protein
MLPFVTPPSTRKTVKVGNEETGILEFEVRGGLTVGESAIITKFLGDQQKSLVYAAKVADSIATAESISLSEAYQLVQRAMNGDDLEEKEEEIRLKHQDKITDLLVKYAELGARNMIATVTAVIQNRLNMPDWTERDTAGMDKALFQGVWEFAMQEQDAEGGQEANPTEEELGKPQRATRGRKSTGQKSP